MAERLDLAKDSTMTKAARIFADAIRKYAPYDAIKKSVRIGRREGRGDSKFIHVTVGNSKVPYARAFDIGSGIHGKLRQTYSIPKIPGSLLGFMGTNDFAGKVIRTYHVDHPGVSGVHYTDRAKKEARPQMRKVILEDGAQSIRLYLRAEFAKIGK